MCDLADSNHPGFGFGANPKNIGVIIAINLSAARASIATVNGRPFGPDPNRLQAV
jgi:hypothetical protein